MSENKEKSAQPSANAMGPSSSTPTIENAKGASKRSPFSEPGSIAHRCEIALNSELANQKALARTKREQGALYLALQGGELFTKRGAHNMEDFEEIENLTSSFTNTTLVQ